LRSAPAPLPGGGSGGTWRIVFSIEIKEALAAFAQANLAQAGYGDVQVEHGDGYHGWEEHAPSRPSS
jgi:protein-L-isoaspartate O-methyltransferase